jgi:hypothetical protein
MPPETEGLSVNSSLILRILGDRSAGKTTYLAALARGGNNNSDNPIQLVEAFNDDGKKLVDYAQNVLEQGLMLQTTKLVDQSSLPDYGLQITVKGGSDWRNQTISKIPFNCKDYPGEFFSDLLRQSSNEMKFLNDYLEDCLEANGILFLIDGLAHQKDANYAQGLNLFLDAWSRSKYKERRFALALTKCEQPELANNREQPKTLATQRFPNVCKRLETWSKSGYGSVEYFTCSAFGMLDGYHPVANAKKIKRDREGLTSVIKEPKYWQPFGLVAPIYWLHTGKRYAALDKY